jgi:hypothetical protein
MTKKIPSLVEKLRPRCGYCNRLLPRRRAGQRGRPPAYCSRAHRQLAYEERRAGKNHPLPVALLRGDMDAMASKAGIERAVLAVLRKLGFLPPVQKKASRLRLVHDDGPEKRESSAD